MKKCTKCKKYKLLSEMVKKNDSIDGRSSWCLTCSAKQNKDYRERRKLSKENYIV